MFVNGIRVKGLIFSSHVFFVLYLNWRMILERSLKIYPCFLTFKMRTLEHMIRSKVFAKDVPVNGKPGQKPAFCPAGSAVLPISFI